MYVPVTATIAVLKEWPLSEPMSNPIYAGLVLNYVVHLSYIVQCSTDILRMSVLILLPHSWLQLLLYKCMFMWLIM